MMDDTDAVANAAVATCSPRPPAAEGEADLAAAPTAWPPPPEHALPCSLSASTTAAAGPSEPPPSPGEVVLTTPYGVATVLSSPDTDTDHGDGNGDANGNGSDGGPTFRCSLWRLPGRSVATCATATLATSTIVRRLPAAPGMIVQPAHDEDAAALHTKEKDKEKEEGSGGADGDASPKLLVLCYSPSTDTYLLSDQATDELLTLPSSSVRPARAARVYPLLHKLMQRADEASRTTHDFLVSSPVKQLTTRVEATAHDAMTTTAATTTATAGGGSELHLNDGGVGDAAAAAAQALRQHAADAVRVPDSQEIHAICDMLRDEELTVLLERARGKLRQLVSDDVPKATRAALLGAGIEVVDLGSPASDGGGGGGGDDGIDGVNGGSGSGGGGGGDDSRSAFFSMTAAEKSREKALKALDALLAQQDNGSSDIDGLKQSVVDQFGTMFDSLTEAAGSDHTLMELMEQVDEKTSEWQAISGRLMSTRSANVFMEGTARLRRRVEAMFFSEGGTDGLELAKAFTEGDVAVARLKSIELGDAVRSRLVSAIELRSDSQGGLDGIIAGALKSMTGDAAFGEDHRTDLRSKISGLQEAANLKSKDAKESLISMLSQKSLYRDLALLRIEETLVDLEAHLDMSAEEMVLLASGDGGTAALFEPLARKAAMEIEKQLDTVEDSVSDETALTILSHVRRIVSGKMTIHALVDEVTSILNDEAVVSAGENLVKQGEQLLDAFEGRSGNKAIDDVVAAAEKAGITKSVVMQRMQSLDVDSVLDTASSAATDEEARRELLSSATDSALDFLLNILPSMPVPPFDGAKDGVVYHLSNLSLEGFKVKKEDIGVSIAGIKAGKQSDPEQESTASKSVRAHELLTIDVKNISADLDDAVWSFEQTYLPYLKGGGMANSTLKQGCIKLQFELRKKRKATASPGGTEEWEPKLCLSEKFVEIGEISLALQGDGKLTWILNKLAEIFKGSLRDYCVRVIGNAIVKRSGWLLENLNTGLAPYWGVILRTSKLDMKDLAEVTESDVTDAAPDPTDLIYDLIFREQVPLGVNLLLNDESGFVRVVDFPRGSQSRKIAQEMGLDPDKFKSATIVAVNGTTAQKHHQVDVMSMLKDPGRPKTIQLKIADDVAEAERVRMFAEGQKHAGAEKKDSLDSVVASSLVVRVTITNDGPLGVKFAKSIDDFGLVICDICAGDASRELDEVLVEAAKSGKITKGDMLSHVGDVLVLGQDGIGRKRALEQLQEFGGKRPLLLDFVKPCSHLFSFQTLCVDGIVGGPEEFILEEKKLESGSKKIIINGFKDIAGIAESSGIFIGDHLITVNGFPVGAGCIKHGDPVPDFQHVLQMLRNESPLALVFARPKREDRWHVMGGSASIDVEGAETFTVAASDYDQLGCEFAVGQMAGTVVVKSFGAVKGFVRQTMETQLGQNILGLSLETVAGQVIPSYASPEMVKNAIARNWPTDVVFCNNMQRSWCTSLASRADGA